MAAYGATVRLSNCYLILVVLVVLVGLPASHPTRSYVSESMEDSLEEAAADFYARSREPDARQETRTGFGRLVTRYEDKTPFTDAFAPNDNNLRPEILANPSRNYFYDERLPSRVELKETRDPVDKSEAVVNRSPKHGSRVAASTQKDDLIGSAIRGQKEEVQGDRSFHVNQLSSVQSFSAPHARSYDYETRGKSTFGDVYFVTIVAGCSIAAMCGVMGTGYCLYRLQQHNKAAADVDYPAYGVVGPITKDAGTGSSPASSGHSSPSEPNRGIGSPAGGSLGGIVAGDRKLAQNAQMYHYHHQKHQMQSTAGASGAPRKEPRLTSTSDADSEEDEVEYIVYECPGLAPTGEMEVKNPLFQDDSTPASPMKTPVKTSPNGKTATASDPPSRD